MLDIIAINGSPRRNKNTATLLDNFLKGAKSIENVSTERIDIYDYNYRGCTGCFSCKLKDSSTYGKCIVKDDAYEILKRIQNCDGVVFGSPIFFGDISGQMHCLLERLAFSNISYEKGFRILSTKHMPTAFIYTMNSTEEICNKNNYPTSWGHIENYIAHILSPPERLCAYDTYQFDNYNKYVVNAFDESAKAKTRDERFPMDCKKAYEAGVRMGKKSASLYAGKSK